MELGTLSAPTAPSAQTQVIPPPAPPTALELFAGAGGLALGVHRAGFALVDIIEVDEACCATLRSNASRLGVEQGFDARDVRTVDFSAYEGIDLLCGGAPCQPFSRAGRRRGRFDERNMLPEVVRAVAQSQPRAFLIENVRGLLFESAENYFKSIIARLRNPTVADPGPVGNEDLYWASAPAPSERDQYAVSFRLLDTADFGLSQRRPRLFIVGIRQDLVDRFEWPVGKFSRESLVEDLRGPQYWRDHPKAPPAARTLARERLPKHSLKRGANRWRTLRDLMVELGPPALNAELTDDPSHVVVPGARLYGKHTGSPIDWVAKTVKAGVHGSPGGEHIVVHHDGSFRYLTVRECARLQGFPADYELPAKRTPAMKQLGNAVAVNVAEAVSGQLRACLEPEPDLKDESKR